MLAAQRKLTLDQKNHLAQWLMREQQANGRIRRGAHKEAAEKYGVSTRTIRSIQHEVYAQQQQGIPVHFRNKRQGITHRDKLKMDEEKVRNLSVLERSTIRKMASKLQVSKSTVGRWIKEKCLKPHTNAIKPSLTEANKLCRMRFSLSHLAFDDTSIKFRDMKNVIHIDEKWFFMTNTKYRYYLLLGEIEPHRTCQSKRFITKVMFMSVVGIPHFSSDGEVLFDGKYGIFPFIVKEPAKRNSKNRSKGTLETKPIQSITKEVIKECIISQVNPAIKAKWPTTEPKNIIIQQDNARPHILQNDPDFAAAANIDGFSMTLMCQPPNSPDTNVNDLGFFRAIQSLQDDTTAKIVDELLANVKSAYEELTPQCLNNVFLTLQGCLTEILKVRGGNNYKIPHMNKGRLQRMGELPDSIEVDPQLVRDSMDYVTMAKNNAGYGYDQTSVKDHFRM